MLQVEQHRRENTQVSTYADCTIQLNRKILNVECKRLHSLRNWPSLVEKASSQLKKSGKKGFVALDCSVLIRPNDSVYRSDNASHAAEVHLDWLEHNIYEKASTVLSSDVLGLILYARVPSLVQTPRLGKVHFSPRVWVTTSFVVVAYRYNKFAMRAMGAIKKILKIILVQLM